MKIILTHTCKYMFTHMYIDTHINVLDVTNTATKKRSLHFGGSIRLNPIRVYPFLR